MIKSWMPSLGGLLLSMGTLMMQSPDPLVHSIGVILNAVGGLLMGLSAKQYNVTGGTVKQ
jgi:hypothetical protein